MPWIYDRARYTKQQRLKSIGRFFGGLLITMLVASFLHSLYNMAALLK